MDSSRNTGHNQTALCMCQLKPSHHHGSSCSGDISILGICHHPVRDAVWNRLLTWLHVVGSRNEVLKEIMPLSHLSAKSRSMVPIISQNIFEGIHLNNSSTNYSQITAVPLTSLFSHHCKIQKLKNPATQEQLNSYQLNIRTQKSPSHCSQQTFIHLIPYVCLVWFTRREIRQHSHTTTSSNEAKRWASDILFTHTVLQFSSHRKN